MLQASAHIKHLLDTRCSCRAILTLWLHHITHKKVLLWFMMILKEPVLLGQKPAQVWGALGTAGQGGSPEHGSITAFTPWACPTVALQGSLSHTAGAVQADKIPFCMWLRDLHWLFWTSLIFLFLPIMSPENFYLHNSLVNEIPKEPETDI